MNDADSLRDNPSAILDLIHQNFRGIIFQQEKIDVARQVLQSLPKTPTIIVELGTYIGVSALAFGQFLKEQNKKVAECKVYSMETEANLANIAKDFVNLAGLSNIVQIVQGDSAQSLKRLQSDGLSKIDVLFIDHWEERYLPDLQLCEDLGLLHPGTVIIADNTDIPGAPEYLTYVRSGGRKPFAYSTRTLTTGAGKNPKRPVSVSIYFNVAFKSDWSFRTCWKLRRLTPRHKDME